MNHRFSAPMVCAIVKIIGILAIAVVAIGCPPEPAPPGDGNGNGGGNGTGNGNGNGATVPAVPAGVAATPGDGQITLTWNESAGATTYDIYRGVGDEAPSDDAHATVAAGSGTTIDYVDSGLTNGTTYRYAIAASNSAGSSERSAVVSATPSELVISADGDPDMAGVQPIAAIPERAGGAQAIVASLQTIATSGDTTPIENATYSIAATPDGHPFAIMGDDLILPADAAIDYEADTGFDLVIQASAPDGRTGSVAISIAIANIDDEAPEFVSFPN